MAKNMVNLQHFTIEEMALMVSTGEAVFIGTLGIYNRPVYQIGEKVFRQYLRVNGEKEFVPGDFYEVSEAFRQNMVKILAKGN